MLRVCTKQPKQEATNEVSSVLHGCFRSFLSPGMSRCLCCGRRKDEHRDATEIKETDKDYYDTWKERSDFDYVATDCYGTVPFSDSATGQTRTAKVNHGPANGWGRLYIADVSI